MHTAERNRLIKKVLEGRFGFHPMTTCHEDQWQYAPGQSVIVFTKDYDWQDAQLVSQDGAGWKAKLSDGTAGTFAIDDIRAVKSRETKK